MRTKKSIAIMFTGFFLTTFYFTLALAQQPEQQPLRRPDAPVSQSEPTTAGVVARVQKAYEETSDFQAKFRQVYISRRTHQREETAGRLSRYHQVSFIHAVGNHTPQRSKQHQRNPHSSSYQSQSTRRTGELVHQPPAHQELHIQGGHRGQQTEPEPTVADNLKGIKCGQPASGSTAYLRAFILGLILSSHANITTI